MADVATAEVFGKRILVEISHTIERFALAAPPDEPLVVVAMFQKRPRSTRRSPPGAR